MKRDAETAVNHRDKAVEDFGKLVTANPENAEYRYFLALACSTHQTPPTPTDISLLERAIDEGVSLIEQYPNRLEFHQLIAKLTLKMAVFHVVKKQPNEAFDYLKTSKSSVEFSPISFCSSPICALVFFLYLKYSVIKTIKLTGTIMAIIIANNCKAAFMIYSSILRRSSNKLGIPSIFNLIIYSNCLPLGAKIGPELFINKNNSLAYSIFKVVVRNTHN